MLLKLVNIKKSYGLVPVLKGINLSVDTSKVVSIVGPSGAGKTTLLQIIGSLDTCDSGDIFFEGVNMATWNNKQKATFRNKKIGFVFQFHNLLPEFTALENVSIPALIAGNEKEQATNNAIELLKYFGLENRMYNKPSELSGGEQQRVAFARALINKPALILADEPTGNLDTHNATEMHKLIFNLRDDFKTTFIIVTHNKELAAMTDEQLTIVDGVMV
ncbi:MAG: ABC transporter ATP-binding protein [Bacteroidetes bacterium]|nr:ABC transporter ATP-binding protein [Bacteroidota bacterium]MBL0050226.1 ABC transporter ATP-binding protein [Bacteroidota bacterium]